VGKGELIANLAASFSEAGNSVALVAVDPFDVSIAGLLGGATGARMGNGDQAAAPSLPSELNGTPVASITGIERVSLLMNGQLPANGEVHGRDHTGLVAEARRSAELVLIDAPPTLAAHEAGRLSAVVVSVVLLCEMGRVTARDAALTVDVLHRVGAPLHGIVLVAKKSWTSRLPGLNRRQTYQHIPKHAASLPAATPGIRSGERSPDETLDAQSDRTVGQ
jgi:Mrp family chromosome partitioning ATPase